MQVSSSPSMFSRVKDFYADLETVRRGSDINKVQFGDTTNLNAELVWAIGCKYNAEAGVFEKQKVIPQADKYYCANSTMATPAVTAAMPRSATSSSSFVNGDYQSLMQRYNETVERLQKAQVDIETLLQQNFQLRASTRDLKNSVFLKEEQIHTLILIKAGATGFSHERGVENPQAPPGPFTVNNIAGNNSTVHNGNLATVAPASSYWSTGLPPGFDEASIMSVDSDIASLFLQMASISDDSTISPNNIAQAAISSVGSNKPDTDYSPSSGSTVRMPSPWKGKASAPSEHIGKSSDSENSNSGPPFLSKSISIQPNAVVGIKTNSVRRIQERSLQRDVGFTESSVLPPKTLTESDMVCPSARKR